jgi:ATP-binding cassette, subfamily B, bacterial
MQKPIRSRDQERVINHFTLRSHWRAARKYPLLLAGASIMMPVSTIALGGILPYLFSHAIELVSQQAPLAPSSPLGITLWQALATAIVGAIANAIGFSSLVQLEARVMTDLRRTIFERLVNESAHFYANSMVGSLTANAVQYVGSYVTIQDMFLIRATNLLLPLVTGIAIAATQSLPLAAIFIALTLTIATKSILDTRHRAPFRRERKEINTHTNGFMADVIGNNSSVRAFAGEHQELRSLDRQLEKWRIAYLKDLMHFSLNGAGLVATMNILQVAGMATAAWLLATGQIGLGLVVFSVTYFQRLSSSLFDFGPFMQTSEILMSTHTITDKPGAVALPQPKGAITFESVTYRYSPEGQAVIDDFNLSIPAGQRVGLVGRSGGGKTTLTNLLLRYDDVTSGRIAIDSHDINDVTKASLRSAIAYVPQESQLFHRSLRENISYSNPEATEKQIIAAAKKAHAWEFIATLPDGLDTEVGERGVKLSGGQRQRIAIARAILKNAPILVLDEATSALDSESERYIQASLSDLMRGRTAIVIAHRLSTIQQMDRIIVLDQGRIIEDGSHDELLAAKGTYAKLWAHQSGGMIEE